MLTMEASRYLSIASLDTNMTDVLEFSSNPIGIAPIYFNQFFVSGSTYQFQVSLPQFWRDPQHGTCIAARRLTRLTVDGMFEVLRGLSFTLYSRYCDAVRVIPIRETVVAYPMLLSPYVPQCSCRCLPAKLVSRIQLVSCQSNMSSQCLLIYILVC